MCYVSRKGNSDFRGGLEVSGTTEGSLVGGGGGGRCVCVCVYGIGSCNYGATESKNLLLDQPNRLQFQGIVATVSQDGKQSGHRIPSPAAYCSLFFLTPSMNCVRPTHIEGYLFCSKSTNLIVKHI